MSKSTENFAQLLEDSLAKLQTEKGALINATVIAVKPDCIVVDAGLKTEDSIPVSEFKDEKVAPGDQIEVVLDNIENGFGETRFSREKARRIRRWATLEKAHKDGEIITGELTERVKGGFIVDLDAVYGFLPGSLIDIKPIRDTTYLEGKELQFKIIKMDHKRNNVVLSRRAVLEQEGDAERQAKLDELQDGQEVDGIVKNITDYGVFVDLGGLDGLLHVTDISWKRVKHPSEVLKVGEEVRVKVLKFDREKGRVSLGIKQLSDDPWRDIERRYPSGHRLFGHVTNVTDYGCFVELEDGIEGLVHMSEMDWTNKNVNPTRMVKSGDEVEVMVLEVDENRRRISLGIKQCCDNPWQSFASNHQKGERISGDIRSITDFGVFVGLDGEIDGLIHLSDLSWTHSGDEAIKTYKKGQHVEAMILAIDPDRERISLGIKQLESNPMATFMDTHKGKVLKVAVLTVDTKSATVQLPDDAEGILKASDYGTEPVKDLAQILSVGDEVEVKITKFDQKNHSVYVSNKAILAGQMKEAKAILAGSQNNMTLGDLLKEQMQNETDES